MDCKLYTIGYIAFEREKIISIINELDIDCLIDVRSVPMSSYAPQYNKPVFSEFLRSNQVYYRNYKEFGARQDDIKYYNADGYLDFDRYITSRQFLEGMKRIKNGIDQNFKFVFITLERKSVNFYWLFEPLG